MKLNSIHKLTGRIVVETGLHIGAGNDVIEIGGLDNPVLKDKSGKPYIPGSSIRGKLRSIMEWQNGVKSDKPCACGECAVCRIFGPHDSKKAEELKLGPPRLLVRDATMVPGDPNEISFTEAKYENTISRITGTAGNPRQLERVHVGTKFSFEIVYRDFTQGNDKAKEDRAAIRKAIDLLKHDYLGGCGSRGSGKVSFEFDNNNDWQAITI